MSALTASTLALSGGDELGVVLVERVVHGAFLQAQHLHAALPALERGRRPRPRVLDHGGQRMVPGCTWFWLLSTPMASLPGVLAAW